MKFLLTCAWGIKLKDIDKKFKPRREEYNDCEIVPVDKSLYNAKFVNELVHKSEDYIKTKINGDNVYLKKLQKTHKAIFIEINSLEDFIEFQNTYGEIIIHNTKHNNAVKEIEIYDADYDEDFV